MIEDPPTSRRTNTDVQEKRSSTVWQIFIGYWLTCWMQIKKAATANHLQQPHEIFMRILFLQEYIWSLHRQNPHPQMMVFVPARDAHLLLAIPALPFFPGPSGVSLLRLFLAEPLPIVVLSGAKHNIFCALFMTFLAKFPDYSHSKIPLRSRQI